MKYIEVRGMDCTLKLTDDTTYQDVTIYCRDAEQMEDLLPKLAIEMLKGD